MLKAGRSLVQDELNHYAWNESQRDSDHEDEVECISSCLKVFILLVDREGAVYYIELQVWLIQGYSQDCIVQELWECSCSFLGGNIQVHDGLVVVEIFLRRVNVK